jgi:hypothetical protein
MGMLLSVLMANIPIVGVFLVLVRVIVIVTIAGYCIALIKIFPKLLRWVSKRSLPLFLQMRFSENQQGFL